MTDVDRALLYLRLHPDAQKKALALARGLDRAASVRQAEAILRRGARRRQFSYWMTEEGLSFLSAGLAVGLPVLAALGGDMQYALWLARVVTLILGPVAVVRLALG